jgi:hypothetical protein
LAVAVVYALFGAAFFLDGRLPLRGYMRVSLCLYICLCVDACAYVCVNVYVFVYAYNCVNVCV